MADILDAGLLILTYNSNDIQIFFTLFLHILCFSDHQTCKDITGSLIQCPLHENEGWLRCSKITFKRTVFCITISAMYKRGCQHLHKYRLSSSVLQRNQCTFTVKIKNFITDTICVIVIIYIDQTYCINLTHLLPPPVLSKLSDNYSDSKDSSP